MSDLKKFGKKLFASVITGMTAFSMSFGAFLPAVVHAADTCPEVDAGDWIKVPGNSAVYYVNNSMERMYVPNGEVWETWNGSDYSMVKTIPASCIDNYPSGGGLNYAPGSRLVKTTVSPSVFAIGTGNLKHKLSDPDVAAALYGANWESLLRIIPDVFDANYGIGAALSSAVPHNGQLIQTAGATKVYRVMDGMLHEVSGDLPAHLASQVRVVTQSVFDAVEMADSSVTPSSLTEDPSQEGDAPSTPETPTTPVGGDMTFSLAGSTPATATVPGGAQAVEYMKFNVTGDGDTLDSITLKLGGIGDRNDFNKVYVFQGDERIGSGLSLNTDDEVTFNLNKVINGLETFTVKADLNLISGSATAGDRSYFQITSASEVDTNATVGGTFPVRGNEIQIGSQDIAAVTIAAKGTDSTEKIGEDDVLVTEFDLEVGNTDDVWLASIRLENKGTSKTDVLSNITLTHNGVVVADGEMSGDYVTFELDELLKIEEGDTERMKVYADLGISDDADTVNLILDELTDLEIFADDHPGSLAKITNTTYIRDTSSLTGGSTSAITITLDGGDIDVTFEGTNEDVRVDQNNVPFGVFNIVTRAEAMDIDTMEFEALKNAGNPCLEDLRLKDVNGLGSYTLTDTDTCTAAVAQSTYTVENLVLNQAVQYEFEVLADISNSATSGSQYHFTWAAAQVTGDGVESDNSIDSDMFSSSNLTGPTMSVNSSSLTVRSNALTDDTVVNGTKNVLMFRGELEAGDTSDIEITSLTVEDSNGTAWDNRIDGLKLYIESAPGEGINIESDTPIDVDNSVTAEQAVFNGFNYSVGASSGNAVMFEIYADITDGSTTGTVDVMVTDLSATDEDSETVNAEVATGTILVSAAPVLTDRDITITGTGSVTLEIDTDFTGLRNDKIAVAGDKDIMAARLLLVASNEDVKIEDLGLAIHSSSTLANLEATFDSISVYSCSDLSLDCLLGTEDFSPASYTQNTSGTITMNNIDFIVPDNSQAYLYVAVDTNTDGTGVDGTASPSTSIYVSIKDSLTTAEGYDSKDDLAASAVTATEATFPTSDASNNVAVHSIVVSEVVNTFDGGSLVGGNQTLFSFEITADGNTNTNDAGTLLDAQIQGIQLQISTDLASEANLSGVQVCSVETGSCVNVTTTTSLTASNSTVLYELTGATDGFVDFTAPDNESNSFSTDEISIESGETKGFVVKGTVGNSTDKFLQGSIQDLNAGGVRWAYDTDDDGTVDVTLGDMKMNEPRPTEYPDVFGVALD